MEKLTKTIEMKTIIILITNLATFLRKFDNQQESRIPIFFY